MNPTPINQLAEQTTAVDSPDLSNPVTPESESGINPSVPNYGAITQAILNKGHIGIPSTRSIPSFFTESENVKTSKLDTLCAEAEALLQGTVTFNASKPNETFNAPWIQTLAKDYRLDDNLTSIRSIRTNRLKFALPGNASQLPGNWKALIGNLHNQSMHRSASASQTTSSPDYSKDNGAIGDEFEILTHKINQLKRTAKFWKNNQALLEDKQPNPEVVKKQLKDHVGEYRKAYQGEQVGIKIGLELAGCVMLPPSKGLAGIFPQREYAVVNEELTQLQEFQLLTTHANKLVQKYHLLDADDNQRITQPKLGCLCIMYAKEKTAEGKKVYVPFFGLSKGPASGAENLQNFLHRMGLPEIDLNISPTDTTMLDNRYYLLKQHFNDLKCVGLKTPSKQAMISYMQFIDKNFKSEITRLVSQVKLDNEPELETRLINQETIRLMTEGSANGSFAANKLKTINDKAQRFATIQINRAKEAQLVAQGGLDPMALALKSLESWHSVKCAEPAAIMAAAQLYYRMADMELSLPFEGKSRIAQSDNLDNLKETEFLAKETCGRCAISEHSFGGLTSSGLREQVNMAAVDVTSIDTLANTLHGGLTQNIHGNKLPAGENHSAIGYYAADSKLPAMQKLLEVLNRYEMAQSSTGNEFISNDSRPQPLPPETEQSDVYGKFWSNSGLQNAFFNHFKNGQG